MTRGRLLFAALVLAGALLPVFASEFAVTLANYIGLYSIVALGLVLLTGVGGLTSFGQAAFVGLGAYTTAYLTTAAGWSPWLTLLAGLAITAGVALVLGLLTLRLSGHYLPLGTIAWGISLYYLFGNLEWLGGQTGLSGIPAIRLFGHVLDTGREFFYVIWLVVLVALVSIQNLLDSRPGRAIRSLRGGGVMAESFGVNTANMKVVIFLYAALLASISGWLYAHLLRFVNPTPFSLNLGIEYLFMVVIGGAGYVWGAIIGATLLTLLKEWLQDLLPRIVGQAGEFETIVLGILLVLLLQRARSGLMPFLARFLSVDIRPEAPNASPDLPKRERRARGICCSRCAMPGRSSGPGRGQRRELPAPLGRDPRTDRSERSRQEHDLQPCHGRARADARRDRVPRRIDRSPADRATSSAAASHARSSTSICGRT